MTGKMIRLRNKLEGKVLREYFSGVPAAQLVRRYGFGIRRIEELASKYKQGKIDIFDTWDKKDIDMTLESQKEEVRLLKEKIKSLEGALKLSNIKAEGYEVMMEILKEEYGIDLSKKVEAEQSKNSRKDTKK